MTDPDIKPRIAAILRTEGLNLNLDEATAAFIRSGGTLDTPHDAIVDRMHALNSRLASGKPGSGETFTGALSDAAFRTFLGGLGTESEWRKLAPSKRIALFDQFKAQQANAGSLTELQSFERQMAVKYGPEFRTMLNPAQKVTLARLTGTRKGGNSYQIEIDQLRASTSGAGNLNIQAARAKRIAQLERLMAGGAA
jgi:hypothetical protein